MITTPILRAASLAALSTALLAAGCKESAAPAQADLPKVDIKVATVHTESTSDDLTIPGRVEPDPQRLVHIYAPLSGRLLSMSLAPGQEVKKGQVVATLQSGDVAQARADFEKARIEVERADHALARGKVLNSHEVLSLADLQELQATDDSAHAEQERARQRIHELGFSENGTSDETTITSPITGTVLDIGTAAGEMQRSLETTNGLATVANLDTVWVTGDLYEQDLRSVHLRDAVTVTFPAYPGESFHGAVANIGDEVDPSTHAVKLRVVLANPQHRFKPAMFATIQVSRPAARNILLPLTAILHDGDTTEVYVPAADGKYALRKVTTGDTVGDKIVITSGLSDGDSVVTEGAAFLREPVGD